ncbi:MAG: bifunctional hydroxymethylpyrimidine kinase/phosphomethylpyrimidine kinase [Myxococcaceae bacterium]|nr:bifunctional hydroxymethylpyrimidine kinase/phosphomethylpyrimidine kinase [Myxococcaceae bacterium]MBH2006220.1 bifunctional hydroxymethylpyrimidine kinase/phosphomethylpyrimidine kinase [Myxococcaceae bacterium]
MKRVLTIAGSDSGGGAGIQADLKTISAIGCYGATAITALTSQNTRGVKGVFPVEPSFIQEQIEAVLEDIGADAIKLGMLYNANVVEIVANCLKRYPAIPVVIDPVMISQSGHRLLENDAILALREYLFPRAYLLTPNLDEATALVGEHHVESMAHKILSIGPKAVLIKGGHRNTRTFDHAEDYLLKFGKTQGTYFRSSWIRTRNTHGTGCTLSAAIACYVAFGHPLSEAVALAKSYLNGAMNRSSPYSIGAGAGPVCHHWKILG